MTFQRVGGIWFWRVWRLGGSFYIGRNNEAHEFKQARKNKRARDRRDARMWRRYGGFQIAD